MVTSITRQLGVFLPRNYTLQRMYQATEHRKGKAGFLVVGTLVGLTLFAPFLAPYEPRVIAGPAFSPPLTEGHLLGTDSYGRDILSRLMYGGRISLLVGIGATTLGTIVGVTIGVISGYSRGITESVLMRFIDGLWAFPWLVIAILMVAIFGNGAWNVMIAISIAYVDDFARIAYGETLGIAEEEYILAAKNIGFGDAHIMSREILPNMVGPLIVQFTIFVARAILIESALSFLGLGVEITTATWGMMLGQGRNYILDATWIVILPGLAIVIAALGINLYGDALRDSFDVRQTSGVD